MVFSRESLVLVPQQEALGSRSRLEVLPAPQRPFEVTGAVFMIQQGIDALSPQNAAEEHRGAFITQYSNGPDTLYLLGNQVGGQDVLETHAKAIWSQSRWFSRLDEVQKGEMRNAFKESTHPLHAHAKEQGGDFFRHEEYKWLFHEAVDQGNTGRMPERSIQGHGAGKDREEVQGMVDSAWANVFADDEARQQRLRHHRNLSPYRNVTDSELQK